MTLECFHNGDVKTITRWEGAVATAEFLITNITLANGGCIQEAATGGTENQSSMAANVECGTSVPFFHAAEPPSLGNWSLATCR